MRTLSLFLEYLLLIGCSRADVQSSPPSGSWQAEALGAKTTRCTACRPSKCCVAVYQLCWKHLHYGCDCGTIVQWYYLNDVITRTVRTSRVHLHFTAVTVNNVALWTLGLKDTLGASRGDSHRRTPVSPEESEALPYVSCRISRIEALEIIFVNVKVKSCNGATKSTKCLYGQSACPLLFSMQHWTILIGYLHATYCQLPITYVRMYVCTYSLYQTGPWACFVSTGNLQWM